MKHTFASAEHLNQLKQTLQEINNLLPLLPVPEDNPTLGKSADASVEEAIAPHKIHLSEMVEAFRHDVSLYLRLSERTQLPFHPNKP